MRLFRALAAGLGGLLAVLGAFAWVMSALSSMAAEPPNEFGLGRQGDRPAPERPGSAPEPRGRGAVRSRHLTLPGLRVPRPRLPRLGSLLAWAKRRRRLAVVLAVVAVFGLGVGLYAFFDAGATAGSGGQAVAGSVHQVTGLTFDTGGITPTANPDVPIKWGVTTLSNGGAVDGYKVNRYDGSNVLQSTGAACSGTVVTTNCTENSVPDGTWKYGIQAKYSLHWLGPESSQLTVTVDTSAPIIDSHPSDPSNVANPTFTFHHPTFTSFECWIDADSPVSCTSGVHAATLHGSNLSDGSHTFHVRALDGNNYPTQSASFTWVVDTTAPVVTLTKVNGVTRTFPYATNVNVTSVGGACGTLAGDSSTINVTVASETGTATCFSGSWSYTLTTPLSTEDTYTASATQSDTAGNTGSTGNKSITVDTTKPVISATATKADTTAYTAGTWTNQNVTVSFSCAETGAVQSGIATNTVGGGGTQSAETSGTNFTNTGTCTDNAGNTADPVTFGPVKIDKTKPVILASATKADTTAYTAGTWTNQNVTVSFSCAETGSVQSGLDTNTVGGGGTQSAETSNGSFTNTGTCTDQAGNTADATTFSPIKIDKTKPVITGGRSPAANANGWNNTDVTVSFTCTDPNGAAPSGIATDTVAGATQSAETSGASITNSGTCVDNAGNVADSATLSGIKIDKTKPVITGSHSPAPNGNGWNNTNVVVSFSCADSNGAAPSGIDSSNVAGTTLTSEGANQSFTNTGTCTDKAGNTADSNTVSGINIDKTGPAQSFALSGTLAGGEYVAGSADAWTLYFRNSAGGQFNLTDTVTEALSGMGSIVYPAFTATTGWTPAPATKTCSNALTCQSNQYVWASGANTPPDQTIAATDKASNTDNATLHFVNDTTPPDGTPAFSVNGTAATSGGSSSTTSSTSFSITGRTDYTEAQSASASGLAASTLTIQSETLTNGSCGAPGSGGPYTSATTIVGTTNPAITAGFCYLYKLTGTDNVGNSASISSTVTVYASATVTYSASGTYTLHIPAGVTSVNFTIVGAGGGGAGGAAGGAGSSISGTITLASNPSGTTLTVIVSHGGIGGSGGAGGSGYGNGGSGGTGSTGGGGGGGSSAIETSGATVIVVAAGGGGAGGNRGTSTGGSGGAGGLPTTSSTANTGTSGGTGTGSGAGGAGGSTSAGGTATNGGGGSPVQNGTAGGNGGSSAGGGGGGGGWGGGAGGSANSGTNKAGGGGGGGSSYDANATGVTVTISPNPVSGANGGSSSGGSGGDGSATFTGAGIF